MTQPSLARTPSVRIDVGEERGPAAVRFDLGEGADRVTAVRLDVVHALGVTSGIVPPGAGDVSIDLRALPAGPAELRVGPILANGRGGPVGSTSFAVPGRAGTGPVVARFGVRDRRLRRPRTGSTLVPRLLLGYRESGADASAVHLELTRPDGAVEHELLPPPPGGEGEIRPFALAAGAPAGSYLVSAAMVDVDGNAGAAAKARFEVGDAVASAPSITRAAWRKDGRVSVRGAGFRASGLAALLNGRPTPIAEADDGHLVLVCSTSVPARLEVRTDLGRAVAASAVGPPPSIEIVPADATVSEGATAQLHAVVRGVTDATVEWMVEDAPAVAISSEGLLSAGPGAPDAIVVHARIVESGVEATARVAVTAPQGRGITIGPRGGTSRSPGGVALTLPGGALAEPAKIAVELKRTRLVQRGIVIGAELALTPAKLAVPATLDVPLRVLADPGSIVEVQHHVGDEWVPAGHATIDATGFTAHLDVARLPDGLRVLIPWPRRDGGAQAISAAPMIDAVHDTPIEEGATVPLLVTGANFVPGLTQASVVRGGTVDARIACRGIAIKSDGTALGLTVEVGPLFDLGEGAISDHVLRIETAAGRAEHPLPILCHDELIVTSGQTLTLTGSRRVSLLRVDAGGTLQVASTVPPVTIDVLGDAVIEGTMTVLAGAGVSGTKGVLGGTGGAGGAGATPFTVASGGSGGSGGGNGNTAGSGGSAGASPPLAGFVAGAGGSGGASGGGGLLPHAGGDGATGGTAPSTRIHGFEAHSSLVPTLGLGAGGGGAGGGGGEGWVFKYTGGGGGGGGAGGGGVGIAAGAGIRLRGVVMANGGDGGNGGTAGTDPPSAWTYTTAGQGGGGGGGGGGTILLQGITDSWNAFVLAVSGKAGATPSPTVQIETRTALQLALVRAPTGDIRADGAIVGLARPVATQGPDLAYIPNLVATQPELDVMGYDATHMKVTSGFGQIRRAITWSVNAGLNAETFACMAPMPLAEGFNEIVAEWTLNASDLPESAPELDAQVLMTSAAVRTRKVLLLSGTIPYYDFTVAITPATLVVATERTGDLTANVTETQPTPLLWSVSGGDDDGTVTAQAGGARYRAPSKPPDHPVSVVVASAFAPNRAASAQVTVLPGVTTSAVAATGRPASASLPSANCGQLIEIDIPPATYALTNQGFTSVAAVEFPLLHAKLGGGCEREVLPIAPTIATGLQRLSVEVPACADPGGFVHVPGHGSVRLQIVPEVTAIDGNRAADPDYTIRGSGFACGETQVLIDGVIQPSTSILSLSCGSMHMAQWPNHNATLIVRTSGGDSEPFSVP
jgi:hypothetical protein